MTINDIYEAARERGLVTSKRQFSCHFLGMASNYASDTGLRECSAGALINRYRHLGEVGQSDLQAMVFQRLLNGKARL